MCCIGLSRLGVGCSVSEIEGESERKETERERERERERETGRRGETEKHYTIIFNCKTQNTFTMR